MFLISSCRKLVDATVPTRATRRALEVAAVAIVSGLVMLLGPEERVTWENFDRVGIGMTRAEVLRILVRKPDERWLAEGRIVGPKAFRWGRTFGQNDDPSGTLPAYQAEAWEAPGLSIIVVYDRDDRVACRFTGTSHGRKDWLTSLFPSYRHWLARLF